LEAAKYRLHNVLKLEVVVEQSPEVLEMELELEVVL
jgi:hypothetical protein